MGHWWYRKQRYALNVTLPTAISITTMARKEPNYDVRFAVICFGSTQDVAKPNTSALIVTMPFLNGSNAKRLLSINAVMTTAPIV
jgi:hypothetical protein